MLLDSAAAVKRSKAQEEKEEGLRVRLEPMRVAPTSLSRVGPAAPRVRRVAVQRGRLAATGFPPRLVMGGPPWRRMLPRGDAAPTGRLPQAPLRSARTSGRRQQPLQEAPGSSQEVPCGAFWAPRSKVRKRLPAYLALRRHLSRCGRHCGPIWNAFRAPGDSREALKDLREAPVAPPGCARTPVARQSPSANRSIASREAGVG